MSTKVAAAVGGIVLLAAAGGGAALYFTGGDLSFEQPVVESVQTDFGTVTEESTGVETEVVVTNPNNQSFPGAASLDYQIYMNSVRVSDGSEGGIGLDPGRNVINFTAQLDNSRIPAWWVTHVNNDERTVVSTQARVGVAGFGASLPPQNRSIETDLLGAFTNDSSSTVAIADREIMSVSNQRAEWGTADAEETPIAFSVDLSNVHDRDVRLDGTEYRIVMNDVVVGEGRTNDSIVLEPGESDTFTANAALDTPRMEQWWVTHLRDSQTTDLRVEVFGLVRDDGELKRVPLNVFDRRIRFETDFLGDEPTQVTELPAEDGVAPEFGEPEVTDTTSRWGGVTEDTTEIITSVDVRNPNEGEFNDLLSLRVNQTTTVNDVPFARDTSTVEELPAGNSSFTISALADNDAVPRWWSRHINNGERSTVVTAASGTADIAVTTLPVDLPDRRTTQETDILASIESEENRAVRTEGGQRVLTILDTQAEWGESTPERAPLLVTAQVRNEQVAPITIERLDYVVDLNSVTIADNSTARSYNLGPGATRDITFRIYLDNQKMDEWWPTHVRNDEVTRMTTNTTAVVDTPDGTRRATFDIFGNGTTIETDFLGTKGDADDGSGTDGSASLAPPPTAATAD
ncbi:LEA type 2 family protein [Haloglomus litoreum]|uniref:LEA type 2 family protein n=1 Tax=Haloglomus litoreum TaxID=3034026 RepID=UPI0023E8C875|nr:LEA type 2 family protein [Haloglomus sp. DT116]